MAGSRDSPDTMPRVSEVEQDIPPFAEAYRSYTKSLERFVVGLCRITTIKGASMISGLSWDVVKDIEKRRLRQRYRHIPLRHLKLIGVDEISIRKGHRYATIVVDVISGHIIWVCQGRKAEDLGVFLRKLKRSGAKPRAVVMDMSAAYESAVKEYFPGVDIVNDHFHVIQQMNKKLDKLRMEYVRNLDKKYRYTVKGARWLVLMSKERLEKLSEEKPVYKERLELALEFNKPLATGYYLKEKLRLLWGLKNLSKAEKFLEDWCHEARASELGPLQEMASLLEKHAEGILAYFVHGITNGFQEGLNHKIKTLKRMSYGYRDWEFFTLKLYALHETAYTLIG